MHLHDMARPGSSAAVTGSCRHLRALPRLYPRIWILKLSSGLQDAFRSQGVHPAIVRCSLSRCIHAVVVSYNRRLEHGEQ